ncbi:TrmO family methyltransferase domain-containing protein [Sporomusa acidovorans]|uniref:TsaA-like domain-containing protein n=1 Tax=Sporomusa acidovorans (strain ATCC 49682 / DSM 3132 / Mol) TaxID=1123286 RepID=A0ABZ3J9Z6_SPOA4|nr:TrmO family methyltransferase [Sporomusa acidovorans]OZC21737.1 S-adenosyl-L-methionine-binding protein [Sporomusa acidovorans DSM 3132]SDD58735.1 tRNA-Thr(GGU) m(6)t(6)A37 methyltransferase TsaA [Sporomusa acidovorans]
MENNKVGLLHPVGEVISEWEDAIRIIKINPEYLPAMQNMNEHSHFWILCWFHNANRSLLQMGYTALNKTYGVFGVRTPARPNPIALTLVKLEKIAGDEIHVSGLDAAQGTPVLDIKPYFEADIVFSPKTPHMRLHSRQEVFYKQALRHHGEACPGLELGVKMAVLAEERLGQLQAPDVTLMLQGDACLADVLQGLTRARLANPTRFTYNGKAEQTEVTWTKNGSIMQFTVRPGLTPADIKEKNAEKLFIITTFSA